MPRSILTPIRAPGFEYAEDDDVDTIELRTLAISVAAACEDEV